MIDMKDCVRGNVYQIYSRNLIVGVFDGKTGFIGIREKFDSVYLFTEYHYDTGPPFGTVRPFKDLGPLVTDDNDRFPVPLVERLGLPYCGICGQAVVFDEAEKARYHINRDGIREERMCEGAMPYAAPENATLFKYLNEIETSLRDQPGTDPVT